MPGLNDQALAICSQLEESAERLRIQSAKIAGATVWDFGVHASGGLNAGLRLADVCLAGRATIRCDVPESVWPGPSISVSTDDPLLACMASQYAGWQIATDDYFAMGSGPMRAAAAMEEILKAIKYHERSAHVVGVLESDQLPTESAIRLIADACGVETSNVTLLVASAASQAGSVQVVARSIETAMHKLHELGFDITNVVSGFGIAPLPPVAATSLDGIGRTNDAILYGGRVTLWVEADDDQLRDLVPKLPSNASHDFGRPFREIFESYDRDFYRIDKNLFSPAQILLCNSKTGRVFVAGETFPDLIEKSFLHSC